MLLADLISFLKCYWNKTVRKIACKRNRLLGWYYKLWHHSNLSLKFLNLRIANAVIQKRKTRNTRNLERLSTPVSFSGKFIPVENWREPIIDFSFNWSNITAFSCKKIEQENKSIRISLSKWHDWLQIIDFWEFLRYVLRAIFYNYTCENKKWLNHKNETINHAIKKNSGKIRTVSSLYCIFFRII